MRRSKLGAVVVVSCLVVTAAAVAYAAGKAKASPVPEVLRAKRFEVVDSRGRVWAVLSAPDETASSISGLVLFGEDGQEHASLGVDPPQLALRNTNFKGSAGLELSPQGVASLVLWSRQDDKTSRVGLGVAPDGAVGLSLSDREGKERAVLELREDGSPRLGMFDGRGEGHAGGWVRATANPRVLVTLDTQGNPQLQCVDKDGRSVWRAP